MHIKAASNRIFPIAADFIYRIIDYNSDDHLY